MASRILKAFDTLACYLLGPLFIGGYSIEEVLTCGKLLKREGYKVTYNLLGEHIRDPVLVDYALHTTVELIDKMDKTNRGNVAIKPTLYGLERSADYFYNSASRIINHAKCAGIEIEFDAESRKHIEDTFSVFSCFASRLEYRGFIRQCVQAHLKDTLYLTDKFELLDKPLRIVKGSGVYRDLDTATLKKPDAVMEQYYTIARINHAFGQRPFMATVRDRGLTQNVIKIFPSPHMFEFQVLYGPFSEPLREYLLRKGYTVRVYIPFVVDWCKDAWKDYGLRRSGMMRRLAWEELKNFRKQRYSFDFNEFKKSKKEAENGRIA